MINTHGLEVAGKATDCIVQSRELSSMVEFSKDSKPLEDVPTLLLCGSKEMVVAHSETINFPPNSTEFPNTTWLCPIADGLCRGILSVTDVARHLREGLELSGVMSFGSVVLRRYVKCNGRRRHARRNSESNAVVSVFLDSGGYSNLGSEMDLPAKRRNLVSVIFLHLEKHNTMRRNNQDCFRPWFHV